MTDPFATDFTPPQPQGFAWEPGNNVPTNNETSNTKENTNMQSASEGKVVVTLKGGRDFDAPWIVVHADDAQDALNQLQDQNMQALIERTKAVAGFFAGGGQSTPQAAPQSQQSNVGQRGKPAGASMHPQGETRQCAHGQMTYRSGINKNGKPYEAFFCPERDRAQQCPAVWL